jgi:hypothetical protein
MLIKGELGPAIADPTRPYVSLVELIFTSDPRGGAYAYLALVSIISRQPAMYSFDVAVAIELIAACLGCAAVFSRSWILQLCLAGALLSSLWYDYGHMGFLGKLLSYPMVLFVFGVFLAFYRSSFGPAKALVLFVLSSGAGLMHNAEVFGFLFTCLAAPFLLVSSVVERRPPRVADFALAAFPPVAAMIASGTLARPANVLVYPDFGLSWDKIVYLITDLDSLFSPVALVPRGALLALFLGCILAWAILVLFALASRNAPALALLCGPVTLILIFAVLDLRAPTVQLAGFSYPAALCAGFLLVQQCEQNRPSRAVLGYLLVTISALFSLHIPRVIGSVVYYTLEADRRQMFAISDFDRLQAAIGDRDVYVDIHGVMTRTIFPIMTELGRRKIKLVWSPESWFVAVASGRTAVPKVEKIPELRLIDATDHETARERVLVETPRYKLVGPSDPREPHGANSGGP